MKPFCYTYQHYDDPVEVFSSLGEVIEYFIGYPILALLDDDVCVYAHFNCKFAIKKIVLKFDKFIEKVEIDKEKLRIETRELIKKDKEKQSKWLKTLTHPITGSPWLCDLGEDTVFNNLLKEKSYKWKDLNSINLEEIENNLL
jgi:hypothetical protein